MPAERTKKMADLIAIGYPDTTTALQAEEEAQRLAKDLVIQPDAIAAIIRGPDGKIKTITNQHAVGVGATWECSGDSCSESCFSSRSSAWPWGPAWVP
jgi:uncharacterized membrane protein